MFQPETEDMLPRTAPKPSAGCDLTEVIAKPTVPEVSILFGQQVPTNNALQQQSVQTQPKQTYAAWKRQLPSMEYNNNAATYPLPNTTFPVGYQSTNSRAITDTKFYRRSLDSACTAVPILPDYSRPQENRIYMNSFTNCTQQQPNMQSPQQYLTEQRSMDSLTNLRGTHTDVLTICAGTQTDNIGMQSTGSPDRIDGPTKEDFQQVLKALQEIREDQARLTYICESTLALLQHQQQTQQCFELPKKIQTHNVATQCELAVSKPPTAATSRLPKQQQQQKTISPVAQSTAYALNTPKVNNQRGILKEKIINSNAVNIGETVPTKPATEKTLVMNELALKYLPNDKLHELLQDINLTTPPRTTTSPDIENLTASAKGPNDMSNASYRYLKKYRLLPDDDNQNDYYEAISSPSSSPRRLLNGGTRIASPQQQHQLLPVRRQQQQQQSPYQPVKASPLIAANFNINTTERNKDCNEIRNRNNENNDLDFENIRLQPKLL